MSITQLLRARLIPFDSGGRDLEEDRAIRLDFNPETLTLKVSSGEQRDPSRRGRQQKQNVGASKATLSFECIFDSTRPREMDKDNTSGQGEEKLDVRIRTQAIAALLQVQGSGEDQAPRRVRFQWGTFIFNGMISDHQEVFDFFSPQGVPLRSKVSLTLTEQNFSYEVTAEAAAQRRAAIEQASAGNRQRATAAGASTLLGDRIDQPTSAGFDLTPSFGEAGDLSAELGLPASLGTDADIGRPSAAGIALDMEAALDAFGPAILGGNDLSRSGLIVPPASPCLGAAGRPASTWAPGGPAPGSRAAGLAAVINGRRSAGLDPTASRPKTALATIPLRGHPPLQPRWILEPAKPLFDGSFRQPRQTELTGERRPHWERLP